MVRSLLLASTLLLVLGGTASAESRRTVEVKLDPQHTSKIGGTATIVHGRNEVRVTIVLDGVFIPENQYPAGVYTGACANLSATPAYKLNPVMSGRSVTLLAMNRSPKHKPGATTYVVAVFNTAATQTMSCGALPKMHEKT